MTSGEDTNNRRGREIGWENTIGDEAEEWFCTKSEEYR